MGSVGVGLGIAGLILLVITVVSLMIAGLGRLNTDQSSIYFTEVLLRIIFLSSFKLHLRIIQFPRHSAENPKQLDCI